MGTNNKVLKNDPHYLGLKNDRISGKEYYEFMDEVMEAFNVRYPNAFYHFEDI